MRCPASEAPPTSSRAQSKSRCSTAVPGSSSSLGVGGWLAGRLEAMLWVDEGSLHSQGPLRHLAVASRSAFPWAKHGKPAARWKGSESQLNLSQPTPLYSGQKRSGNVRKPMNSIEFQPGTLPGRLGSVLATSLLQLQMHRPTRLNCRSTSAKQEATLYFTSLGKPRLLWPSIVCFKASEELRMSI